MRERWSAVGGDAVAAFGEDGFVPHPSGTDATHAEVVFGDVALQRLRAKAGGEGEEGEERAEGVGHGGFPVDKLKAADCAIALRRHAINVRYLASSAASAAPGSSACISAPPTRKALTPSACSASMSARVWMPLSLTTR